MAVGFRGLRASRITGNVKVKLALLPGADWDTVKARVEGKLAGYCTPQLLGETVLRAKLGQLIYEVDGVENYQLILPTQDVTMTNKQVPLLGTGKVEEMT